MSRQNYSNLLAVNSMNPRIWKYFDYLVRHAEYSQTKHVVRLYSIWDYETERMVSLVPYAVKWSPFNATHCQSDR